MKVCNTQEATSRQMLTEKDDPDSSLDGSAKAKLKITILEIRM
jgi:hypothetical protein